MRLFANVLLGWFRKGRDRMQPIQKQKKEKLRISNAKGCGKKAFLLAVCVLPGLLFAGCQGGSQPDGGAIFREAYAKAEAASGSTSWYESNFSFSPSGLSALTEESAGDSAEAAEGEQSYSMRSDTVYRKDPFGLYTVSVSNTAGTPGSMETYIVEGENEYLFYTSSGDGWTKSSGAQMDTDPASQVELLKLLSESTSQSYLREEELDGILCHKLEVTFSGEALRNVVETVVSASGMDSSGSGLSGLLVESLSNREDGDAVRGYCWIEKDSGLLAKLEIDGGDILQKTFSSIDGAENGVTIGECKISGGFTEIEGGTFPDLPEEAQNASSTEAVG